MKRREREEYISKRAYELASSGFHISPITIVSALLEEGYPEAADILNSDIIRNDLRTVCAHNWRGAPPVVDPDEAAEDIGADGDRRSTPDA